MLDVPEPKDPKKLKDAIKTNLNGINIKQIKFTNNNNMLIYLYDSVQYQQLASNATIFNNKVITELRNKTKLFSVVIKGINFENIQEFKEELKQKGIVDMKEIKSAKSNSITINKVKK